MQLFQVKKVKFTNCDIDNLESVVKVLLCAVFRN